MSERCETCRFWSKEMLTEAAPGNSGECRRHAPTRVMSDTPILLEAYTRRPDGNSDEGSEQEGCRRVWPLTYWMDWCGEWRAKDGPPAKDGKPADAEPHDYGWWKEQGLSARAVKIILAAASGSTLGGRASVADLCRQTIDDIEGVYDCGPTTLHEILNWLFARGLHPFPATDGHSPGDA